MKGVGRMIRFGICAPAERAVKMAEIGYDYIELGLAGVAAMDEATFEKTMADIYASPIRAEALNTMVPATIPLTGDKVNRSDIVKYLNHAIPRAAKLGARAIVFGSGGARRVPEGFCACKAYEQINDYLILAGDVCKGYGITVAIEPLNLKECNILNSVAEGTWVANRANHPNVRVLADLFHIAVDGQSLHEIRAAGACMAHTHIANPNGRVWPMPSDGYDYGPFFKALKDAGYNGRMSIEAKPVNDFEADMAAALGVLKSFI